MNEFKVYHQEPKKKNLRPTDWPPRINEVRRAKGKWLVIGEWCNGTSAYITRQNIAPKFTDIQFEVDKPDDYSTKLLARVRPDGA